MGLFDRVKQGGSGAGRIIGCHLYMNFRPGASQKAKNTETSVCAAW